MSHNIANVNGQNSIAFTGNRNDVWHRLGQEMAPGMSIDDWAKAAGLDWNVITVPAKVDLSDDCFAHLTSEQRNVSRGVFTARSDNGYPLGYVSERWQAVQPRAVLNWFQEYISADSNFQLDVAGALKQGEIVWATATYNGGMDVAGDKHIPRLLMTTTFDGTGATINQATMTRVVCNNTLKASLATKGAVVKTRHNTQFNAERVGQELSQIAQSFKKFKDMGDAMADTTMKKDVVSKYFKALLDIPFEAKTDDVSARKLNQFADLNRAYGATVREGTTPETAWTALNAVTRYVDHDRSTRGGSSQDESRFLSAQFGSGAAMKAKAVELLTTDEDFKSLMSRPLVSFAGADVDVKSLLSRPLHAASN
jgi:phage/plasmid-like protein (TIGR03299 family)